MANTSGSYVKLLSNIYYGIHPSIVPPNFHPDNYIILCPEVPRILGDSDIIIGNPILSSLNVKDLENRILYYEIRDRTSPSIKMLLDITSKVQEMTGSVYIACRGGHGRSGVVAGAVYAHITGKSADEVLDYVLEQWRAQRNQELIRPKLRALGSPQTNKQRNRLRKFISHIHG